MKAIIKVVGYRGHWKTQFTIGVQTFTVCQRESKKECNYYAKMLRAAFDNLGITKTK